MRSTKISVAISLLLMASFAAAQEKPAAKSTTKKGELSDAQYTARSLAAAPKSMVKTPGLRVWTRTGK